MERRLAAILAADVTGYSRLMAADEAGTLARLQQLRAEILEPRIGEFHGHIVGSAGDSLLIEFGSAVNAVTCAVQVQEALAEQNAKLPDAQRMVFRMGVNLGDVIAEGGTIHGDGVNVAARLEKLAEPGGVCISRSIHDQVKGKLGFSYADLGEQRLHNIREPVQAYQVQLTATVAPELSIRPQSDNPSIAVLPFLNMSGDPEQQYFSDGITEDILTELSRCRFLTVIARNSSFRFRGNNVDMVRVGRELGAQYLLEGSVRKLGGKIRITAQLIDAVTGSHVWAERFDRAQDEIFAVQDKVVRMIVGTLVGRIQAVGLERAGRKPPATLAAYDCVLRADAIPFTNREAQAEARRLTEKAIELDPAYGRAYAQLAVFYCREWLSNYNEPDSALEQACTLANRAIALDDNDSNSFTILGWVHTLRRSYDLAEHCFQKAIALNPNRPTVMATLGMLYGYMGKPEEGIAYYNEAKLIDQYFEPTWYWSDLGVLHFIAGRYEEAILYLSRFPTTTTEVHAYLAACYALTNRRNEAAQHARKVLHGTPDFSSLKFLAREPFKEPSDRNHLLEGLRKAGLP